ncbi:MAG: PQQ-binding-like beta-propeller repeat protein [Planctomycetota bacterium]
MLPMLYGIAVSSVLVSLTAAQTESAWTDSFNTQYQGMSAPLVRTLDTGGVVVGFESTEFGSSTDGVAVIRRLTENGDLAWEVTHSLERQKFAGLWYRQYLGDLDSGPDGAVAFVIVSEDSMEITMLEADGTQRWSTTMNPVLGPNYDRVSLVMAPDGDLLVAANEGWWAAYGAVRAEVWRLDSASGAVLWSVDQAPADNVRIAVDGANNTYVLVRPPAATSRLRLTRYDSGGQPTGFVNLIASDYSEVLRCDDGGRCFTITEGPGVRRLTSISPSLNIEWTETLPNDVGFNATLMADGHVVVRSGRLDVPLRRYSRFGTLLHATPPPYTDPFHYMQVAASPNGNSIAMLAVNSNGSAVACRAIIEERDPTGALVHSYEIPAGSSSCRIAENVAVDDRANVYAIYVFGISGQNAFGATNKLLLAGEIGSQYCSPAVVNSTGQPASVRAFGSSSAADNNLSLLFRDLPPGSTLLPVGSRMTGFVPMAGTSQGTLCLSGGVGRFDEPGEIRVASSSGQAAVQLELTQFPTPGGLITATAGETWNFQAWYRDANPTVTSNFTDAVAVTLR